jgi:putative acetyltransferase
MTTGGHVRHDARTFTIRPIARADNAAVADIIRIVMPEFGASGPGYSINDAEVDDMYGAYSGPRAAYFVICADDRPVGGGGVAQLDGGDEAICELKKMYLLPEARGTGMGQRLLERCLDAARAIGFRQCYLETLSSMSRAHRLYDRAGFRQIDGPLGATGHFLCDRWYLRDL